MKTRFVGIDPGDRWCGYATLRITPTETGLHAFAQSGVFDRRARTFPGLVQALIPAKRHVHYVAIEDYRERPVGHRSWQLAETPELIGALRYLALERQHLLWRVAASDPTIALEELGFFQLAPFMRRPTGNSAVSWDHALSAWRVLLRMLAKINVPLLSKLRTTSAITYDYRSSGNRTLFSNDLMTTLITWEIPHATRTR